MPVTTGNPPSPRESHTAVSFTPKIGGPKLLIYGGMCGNRLNDVYILDIHSMCWNKLDVFG